MGKIKTFWGQAVQVLKRHFGLSTLAHRTIVTILIGLFLSLVLAMFSDEFLEFAGDLLGVTDKNRIVTTLALALGGATLLLRSWASYDQTKSIEQSVAAQHTANLHLEHGQRQERLKSGVAHLGDQSESVRLGGAYELLHLAKDFPTYRQSTLNILCAHIRQMTSQSSYQEAHHDTPSSEIQSLLTLLFEDSGDFDIFSDCDADLRRSWLRGADLIGARLERSHLQSANLSETSLADATLRDAFMIDADLRGSYLIEADLRGAVLAGASLQRANLKRARMHGAVLDGTDLQAANLSYTALQGAVLIETEMQGAMFHETDLRGISTSEAESGFLQVARRAEKESDPSGVLFAGFLSEEKLAACLSGTDPDLTARLKAELMEHTRPHPMEDTPTGVRLGSYTRREAMAWAWGAAS